MPVAAVVEQHVEEATVLRNIRSRVVQAAHVKLRHLRMLDERLDAHLDGLGVAATYGAELAAAALDRPGRGEAFTAVVRAIESRDAVELDKLLALSEALPACRAGVISAFGWVSAGSLRGITTVLLQSPNRLRRVIGLAACAMHQVDPGAAIEIALEDAEPALRARALRVVADRGQVVHLPKCLNALADGDFSCVGAAVRACVLLGDRHQSIEALDSIAAAPGPWQEEALGLTLKVHTPLATHEVLKSLLKYPSNMRLVIKGIGFAGDPRYVPWLIRQMQDLQFARLAGESFSFITGLDLADLNLDRNLPEDADLVPTYDPNDEDVAMDEDDGLPWPDPVIIDAWWQANGHRFTPSKRYFMGEPPSFAHCVDVLKTGFQRQRNSAAVYLCLLNPGTPLFNTAAPAWRQERWLNAMSA